MTHPPESHLRPTDVLREEHETIGRVLTALEHLVSRLRGGAAPQRELFEKILDFIREFADGCHHQKEEEALFPALTARGMPVDEGPIAVMLEEHAVGRRCVSGMRDALGRLKSDPDGARVELADHADAYTQLLRQHIYKENEILFRMAEQTLTPDDERELAQRFAAFESERSDDHDRYTRFAGEIEAGLGVG